MREPVSKKKVAASLIVIVLLVAILSVTNTISWDGVFQSFKSIGIEYYLLALCMAIIQYLCVALRFIVLLLHARVPPFQVCRIFTNGQLFNHLFPARAGDLYKVVAMKRAAYDDNFSTAYVVSALIIERTISTLVLFVLILFLVDWSEISVANLLVGDRTDQITIFLVVLTVAAAVLYLLQKKIPKLRAWLVELKRGFVTILNLRRFTLVALLSVFMWSLEVMSLKFLASPLGIDITLGQGLFVLLLLNIGIAVPVTLGNIGTYEAVVVIGLGLLGVGTNEAIAIAVSHHFLQILSLFILTAIFNAINQIPQ